MLSRLSEPLPATPSLDQSPPNPRQTGGPTPTKEEVGHRPSRDLRTELANKNLLALGKGLAKSRSEGNSGIARHDRVMSGERLVEHRCKALEQLSLPKLVAQKAPNRRVVERKTETLGPSMS